MRRISLLVLLVASMVATASFAVDDATDPNTEGATAEDVKMLKNPVVYTKKSVARGKNVYLRYCQECHGRDGKSTNNIEEEATDLTRPVIWRYGTTDGEVFKSLKKGGGDVMPPFGTLLKDQDLWSLVNFMKSIGPKDKRPAYVEEKKETEKETEKETVEGN